MGVDLGEDVAWAASPLLLGLVAEFAQLRKRRPELDLTDLITEVVDSQLGSRDMNRGVNIRPSRSHARAREELAAVAARSTDTQAETLSYPGGNEFLDFVAERSAIIWAQAEDSTATRYGFTHPVFRDYFAGLWLAQSEFNAEQLAGYAADPKWRRATRHALALLPSRELERAAEKIWEAADQESALIRWSMRTLVLRATMASSDRRLRARFIELATTALRQAQRDAEREILWAPIAELLDRADQAPA